MVVLAYFTHIRKLRYSYHVCTLFSILMWPLTLVQDRDGNPRVTGEEWLVKKVGAYLPGAYEEVVDVVDAYVLTEKVWVVTCEPPSFDNLGLGKSG